MKTSEFIKRVNELGYRVVEGIDNVRVFHGLGMVAIVYTHKVNKFDTFWGEGTYHELFDVLDNYVRTPIEEREDDKKYYLVARDYYFDKDGYFNYTNTGFGWYIGGSKRETAKCQTTFTEKEIKNHKFRYIMERLEKEKVNNEV